MYRLLFTMCNGIAEYGDSRAAAMYNESFRYNRAGDLGLRSCTYMENGRCHSNVVSFLTLFTK